MVLKRAGSLTAAQLRARRNALWLSAIHIGLPDLLTGELIPVTVAELAGLWDLHVQTCATASRPPC